MAASQSSFWHADVDTRSGVDMHIGSELGSHRAAPSGMQGALELGGTMLNLCSAPVQDSHLMRRNYIPDVSIDPKLVEWEPRGRYLTTSRRPQCTPNNRRLYDLLPIERQF